MRGLLEVSIIINHWVADVLVVLIEELDDSNILHRISVDSGSFFVLHETVEEISDWASLRSCEKKGNSGEFHYNILGWY